jgi:hypothetical protein
MADRGHDARVRHHARDPLGGVAVQPDRLLHEQSESGRRDGLLRGSVRQRGDAHVHRVETGLEEPVDVRERAHPVFRRELSGPPGVDVGDGHELDVVEPAEHAGVAGGDPTGSDEPDPACGHDGSLPVRDVSGRTRIAVRPIPKPAICVRATAGRSFTAPMR